MVTRYGMSNIGQLHEGDNNEQMYLGGEYNEAMPIELTQKFAKLLIIVSRSQRK
jgi:ATP-dependent Zn protease